MPHSLNVLREWRLRREDVKIKKVFLSLDSSQSSSLFDKSLFIKLRNYLIVEIVLANAQRSGIIDGMLIGEVLNAKDNANNAHLQMLKMLLATS